MYSCRRYVCATFVIFDWEPLFLRKLYVFEEMVVYELSAFLNLKNPLSIEFSFSFKNVLNRVACEIMFYADFSIIGLSIPPSFFDISNNFSIFCERNFSAFCETH